MKQLGKFDRPDHQSGEYRSREPAFDIGPYIRHIIPQGQFGKFYAFYGLTPHHPLYFRFHYSSLAGSYFLGKCIVDYSVLYKSDIRGDELKCRGELFRYQGREIALHSDEVIRIQDSFLLKTLVHSYSHDPENPEEFLIQNTASLHYANIHGSTVEGFFGPLCHGGPHHPARLRHRNRCLRPGGELAHHLVEPGTIWIQNGETFDFHYRFPQEILKKYIDLQPGQPVRGVFYRPQRRP